MVEGALLALKRKNEQRIEPGRRCISIHQVQVIDRIGETQQRGRGAELVARLQTGRAEELHGRVQRKVGPATI